MIRGHGKSSVLRSRCTRSSDRALLKSIYEKALTHELQLRQIPVACQQAVPARYKGKVLEDFRLGLLVGGEVIVELKVVEVLLAIHTAQLLT
jgi:GxxExxY protein